MLRYIIVVGYYFYLNIFLDFLFILFFIIEIS